MLKLVTMLTVPALLVAAAVLLVLAHGRDGLSGEGDGVRSASPVGPRVPAFQAQTLSGQTVNLPAGYKGKLVLLDFWATWCGPCVREIPHLVKTYERYHAQGFEILGVTLDGPQGIRASHVNRFVRENNMRWEHIYHNAVPIATAYRVVGIPAAFLVDGDTGRLLASGETLRGAALPRTIEKYLRKRNEQP
jgi:thiol-disulfide isomerase/thioredoxin